MVRSSLAAVAVVVVLAASASGLPEVERRDGSTITVQTTQFNPAITNQGGTTNAAGTFNVSPLATSTSYVFQTLQQTTTFNVQPAATQVAQGGNGAASSTGVFGDPNLGGSAGSTVIVTAPTSTMNMATMSTSTSGSGSSTATGVVTASNGLPSLAAGQSNAGAAMRAGKQGVEAAVAMVVFAAVMGAAVVL